MKLTKAERLRTISALESASVVIERIRKLIANNELELESFTCFLARELFDHADNLYDYVKTANEEQKL